MNGHNNLLCANLGWQVSLLHGIWQYPTAILCSVRYRIFEPFYSRYFFYVCRYVLYLCCLYLHLCVYVGGMYPQWHITSLEWSILVLSISSCYRSTNPGDNNGECIEVGWRYFTLSVLYLVEMTGYYHFQDTTYLVCSFIRCSSSSVVQIRRSTCAGPLVSGKAVQDRGQW